MTATVRVHGTDGQVHRASGVERVIVAHDSFGDDSYEFSASEADVVAFVNLDAAYLVTIEWSNDESTSEEAGRVSDDAASDEGETEDVSQFSFSALARWFRRNTFSLQPQSR